MNISTIKASVRPLKWHLYDICVAVEHRLTAQERTACDRCYASHTQFARLVWMAIMRVDRIVFSVEDAIYMSIPTMAS